MSTNSTRMTDAERRRQRREQKILNKGGDRLSKITGTAHEGFGSFATDSSGITPFSTPPISRSSSTSGRSLRAPSPEASRPVPDLEGSRSTPVTASRLVPPPSNPRNPLKLAAHIGNRLDSEADPSEFLGAPIASSPSSNFNTSINSMSEDLFRQQLERMQSATAGIRRPSVTTNETPSPSMFPNLNDGMGLPFPFPPDMLGAAMQSTLSPTPVDRTAKWWTIIHFVAMAWLGFVVVFRWGGQRNERIDTSDPLFTGSYIQPGSIGGVAFFWYFTLLEFILQAVRIYSQKGQPPVNSSLSQFALSLPPPISDIATLVLRYRLIWKALMEDLCVLIFIVGLGEIWNWLFS